MSVKYVMPMLVINPIIVPPFFFAERNELVNPFDMSSSGLAMHKDEL